MKPAKENVMIYPYSGNSTDILRSKKFVNNYNNILVCTIKGWGLEGKDAGFADGGETLGIKVADDFSKCLEKADTIIFVESEQPISKEKFVYPMIREAIAEKKNIIDLLEINELEDEIKTSAGHFGLQYITYRNKNVSFPCNDFIRKEGIVDINTPIIAVIGESENTQKFLIQIKLKEAFESKGYNVALIGSNVFSELIGEHTFPSFMKQNKMDPTDQILSFNRFVKLTEQKYKPDIFIIGTPGGIMPCTKKFHGDFGLLAYKVFQAINVDVTVFSAFYEDYFDIFFDKIQNFLKYRLGLSTDGINISNRHIDWEELEEGNTDKIPYTTIDDSHLKKGIEEMKQKTNIPLINIRNEIDVQFLTDQIIEGLSRSSDKMVF